jgi:tRNA (guanine26-N2/guanine27-N2)-dimethyltransferase
VLQEGQAKVIYKEGEVFYNPIQEFNRDVSVAAIQQFVKLLNSESPLRSSTAFMFSSLLTV